MSVLIAWLGLSIYRFRSLSLGYGEIQYSDEEKRVIEILGEPDEIAICKPNQNISWGHEQRRVNNGEYVKKYIYGSPIKYVIPDVWEIGFSRENRAISKYRFQSP